MRKQNETPLCAYTVSVYANSEKLDEPTGSGSDADSFATSVSDQVKEHLEQNSPNLSEQFEGWDQNDLRIEITPIV